MTRELSLLGLMTTRMQRPEDLPRDVDTQPRALPRGQGTPAMDSKSLILLYCLSTIDSKGIPQFPYLFNEFQGTVICLRHWGTKFWFSCLVPNLCSWHLRPAAACMVLLTEIQQHAVRGESGTKFFLQVIGPVQQGLQLLSKLPPLRLWL